MKNNPNQDFNLSKFIDNIINYNIFKNSDTEINDQVVLNQTGTEQVEVGTTPTPTPTPKDKDKTPLENETENNNDSQTGEGIKKSESKQSIFLEMNWRVKVQRFLYFCLNGGICDYAFNFMEIGELILCLN